MRAKRPAAIKADDAVTGRGDHLAERIRRKTNGMTEEEAEHYYGLAKARINAGKRRQMPVA
jgi:predicted transcriptional regulator